MLKLDEGNPVDDVKRLAALRREFATEVVRRLTDAGFVALWAGGCVRDYLLGHAPIDYDVATSARPEQVRELFGYRRTLPVGASFGVIVVLGRSKEHGQIEVATFRTDAAYSDGRRPDQVSFSTPEADAQRRDFTINGMFFDPQRGETIDYVGGREDLERRQIRAIGVADHRIAEDKLRMLRAVRFAARFEFEIDRDTYAAIHRHSPEVALVSAERIAAEIRKTLLTRRAAWGLDRWAETGLLKHILPRVALSWPEVADSARSLLSQLKGTEWTVVLAAIYWPIVKQAAPGEVNAVVAELRRHLRLANEELDQIAFVLSSQQTLEQATNLSWSRVQPNLAHPHARHSVALIEARRSAGEVDPQTADWLRKKLGLPSELLDPRPLITGQDLIGLGMRPGPVFSHLLQSVRDQQLDGGLKSSEDAIRWLKGQQMDAARADELAGIRQTQRPAERSATRDP